MLCLVCACSGEPQFSRYKDFARDQELDLKACLLRDLKVKRICAKNYTARFSVFDLS